MILSLTEKREVRNFGLAALLFFSVASGVALWRQHSVLLVLFANLAIVGGLLLALPERLRPVYKTWRKMGHIVGLGVTAALLTTTYFLVITPAGIIKRVFGGPPLPTKPDRRRTTYWIDRPTGAQTRERFFARF